MPRSPSDHEGMQLLQGDASIVPEQDILRIAVDPDRHQELLQHQNCSAATRLPFEILAYIFEFYVARSEELIPASVLAHGPFCLAHVCTLWKSVAESDPRLWMSIYFYFPESQTSRDQDVSGIQPVFDQHLKMSGTLPISLTFTDHRPYHSTTERLVYLLVDRLRMHAWRWRHISLELPGRYFPDLFMFTQCDLSSLEYLCINGNLVAYTPSITLLLNLQSTEKLKSFTYNGPGPSMEDMIDLNWENLAELSFEFAPHYGGSFASRWRFRDLIRCQNITTFSLGIDRSPRLRSNQTITLPRLQTLRVRRLTPYAHASGPIEPLILPQLQTLEIDAVNLVTRNQRWHDRTFSDLLARSQCRLLHLSIRDVDFPNEELVRCIALSRALTSLCFIPCPRSQDLGEVISRMDVSHMATGRGTRTQERRQGRAQAPQLREITLASSVEGHLGSILDMLHSRIGASARAAGVAVLRRAEVVFFDLCHDTDVDQVRVPGDPSKRVASFREELAQLVLENRNENGREDEDEDRLEASVVIDSPYLPEYIDIE